MCLLNLRVSPQTWGCIYRGIVVGGQRPRKLKWMNRISCGPSRLIRMLKDSLVASIPTPSFPECARGFKGSGAQGLKGSRGLSRKF